MMFALIIAGTCVAMAGAGALLAVLAAADWPGITRHSRTTRMHRPPYSPGFELSAYEAMARALLRVMKMTRERSHDSSQP